MAFYDDEKDAESFAAFELGDLIVEGDELDETGKRILRNEEDEALRLARIKDDFADRSLAFELITFDAQRLGDTITIDDILCDYIAFGVILRGQTFEAREWVEQSKKQQEEEGGEN